MTHPTLTRAAAIAAAMGSKATTQRGILAALKSVRPHNRAAARRQLGLEAPWRSDTPADWKAREARRVRDPLAKRAQHDAKFRRAYVTRLRRQRDALRVVDASTACEWYADDAAKRGECQRLIKLATGRADPHPLSPANVYIVPVELSDAPAARRCGATIDLRGKDAELSATLSPSFSRHTPGEMTWKGGRPSHYSRAISENRVRSLAYLHSPQRLEYVLHETTFDLIAPAGFSWSVDQLGLRLVHDASGADHCLTAADHHPTAADLTRPHAVAQIVATIEQRLDGVFVSLRDSLAAGNCEAGTIAFARQHGLDVRRHYPAAELLPLAKHDSRVRPALLAAQRRAEREEAQGFCSL